MCELIGFRFLRFKNLKIYLLQKTKKLKKYKVFYLKIANIIQFNMSHNQVLFKKNKMIYDFWTWNLYNITEMKYTYIIVMNY